MKKEVGSNIEVRPDGDNSIIVKTENGAETLIAVIHDYEVTTLAYREGISTNEALNRLVEGRLREVG